jgi:hypothetical protein
VTGVRTTALKGVPEGERDNAYEMLNQLDSHRPVQSGLPRFVRDEGSLETNAECTVLLFALSQQAQGHEGK